MHPPPLATGDSTPEDEGEPERPVTPSTVTASEARDPEANGGGDSSPLTTLTDFPHTTGEGPDKPGRFATAQLEDETLTQAWAQVVAHNGNLLDVVSCLTYPHFVTRQSLLYRVTRQNEQEVEQLVVPRGYVSKVLFMAHAHPLGAHLGVDKTRERIESQFYWPGIR